MAHNAYFPSQTPLGQQAPIPGPSPVGHQYAQHPQQQYYQQPQNIYQQLGQAQPQPHLQRLYQQQQGQYAQQPPPAQPGGYAQQQSHGFVQQRPVSTSFQPPQHGYAPPTTPFQQPPPPPQQQQQPYTSPTQQYAPGQYGSSLQQPPRGPISRTPSAQGFAPTNAYAGQGYMNQAPAQELNPPPMSSMMAQQQQRRSPQPPPPAPSALIAQQTMVQRRPSMAPSSMSQGHPQMQAPMQMQIRQQPPPPQQPQQQPPPPPQSHVMQMQQRHSIHMPPQQMQQHSQFAQQIQQNNPVGSRRPLPQLSQEDPNAPPIGLARSGTAASRPLSMPPPINTSNSFSAFNPEPSPLDPPLGQPMSASSIPPPSFVQRQIQQIQAMQAQKQQQQQQQAAGMSTSPSSSMPPRPPSAMGSVRSGSRPLPAAPGSQQKRNTVDLGSVGKVSGLPNTNSGSGFGFGPSSSSNSNLGSVSTSNSQETSSGSSSSKPGTGIGKGFPSTAPQTAAFGHPRPVSRTTVMAATQSNSAENDTTPKRTSGRASPPRFSKSISSSPTKEDAKPSWVTNSTSAKPSSIFSGGAKNVSTPDLGSSSIRGPLSPGSATASTTSQQKKFTPVWKRTIPDYPSPVFGYAAGMVADPFAKPPLNANASSTSIATTASSSKANDTTPKANKVLSEKERKKLEKEEKKRAKEEEKLRKKMAKKGVVAGAGVTTPVKSTVGNAMGASTSASGSSPSQLPYLNPTPPRTGGAPAGAYSKAYEHGQQQHQHLMNRGAVFGQGSAQTTPTRQIQVRGQPMQPAPTTPGGTVARYSVPLARQSSTEEDEDDDDDDEEDEDDEDDDDDVEKAYQYEGSDYSEETSEQDYPPPASRKALEQQRNKQEEERQYREYLIQQQMAQAKQTVHKKPASGSSPGRHYQEDDGYEHRPSPSSRHAKSRSSMSDGYVVVAQAQSSSRKLANAGSRPSHSRAQSYNTNAYENSEEDDWEKLQAYESSPHRTTPKARGKSRRYQEEEEDEDDDDDDEGEESGEAELRKRYMAKRKRERERAKAEAEALAQAEEEEEERILQERASRHRREASERDVATVRKYHREPEYDVKTAKQAVQKKGVREKVEDIDWDRQERLSLAQNGITRKYQQQLKRGDDEEEDGGRGRDKTKVKKRASLRDMFRSRSRSKPRYVEPDEEEEADEDFPKRKSAKKVAQPPKKLVKQTTKRHVSQSEPESVDSESVETTITEDSAASRLANKFKASVMKFSGSQSQKASQHQKTPSQSQQSQAQRQSGFSPAGSGSLYFGISDDPPQVSSPVSTKPPPMKATHSFTSAPQAPASSRVRGEVTRSRVNLKADTLDDPPPRSLRTPSPSPGSANPRRQSMYQYSNEAQPRQTDFQQRPRPQSQIYSATPKSNFMDNMQQSRGGGTSSEITQPKRRELPQPSSQSRPQSQSFASSQSSMTFDTATGLPVHHQQAMQGYAPPPQLPLSRPPSQRQLQQQYNNQSAPSTPRQQQQPITIESPAPLKMANILQMEEDGAEQERRRQDFQHQQQYQGHQQNVPLINVHSTGQQQYQSRPPSVPSINVHQTGGQQPYHHQNHSQGNIPSINVGSPPESAVSSPRIGVHHTGRTDMTNGTHQMIPIINFDNMPPSPGMPSISVNEAPSNSPGGSSRGRQVFEVPGISVSGQFDEPSNGAPQISISVSGDGGSGQSHNHSHGHHQQQQQPQQARFVNNNARPTPPRSGTGGLICGGCQGPIVGRIVSAMGMRWHPNCFKCSVCSELLEHVSSYEHDGKPYCHLDYHENFAPRCYSCKTPIIEEQFISLDDPALGKRTYHMEHFFCAECGDPFLTPSMSNTAGELALSGDGDFEGFTVYKGHPYCEACHVRLRLPKCKKCKKSIRDHDRAVEALGGKWCWSCFVCEGCQQPFEDPSFFQRDGHPFCEHCFSVILRNEM